MIRTKTMPVGQKPFAAGSRVVIEDAFVADWNGLTGTVKECQSHTPYGPARSAHPVWVVLVVLDSPIKGSKGQDIRILTVNLDSVKLA
jgi:hypothetical protein